ncbi:MAG: hypothetical protein Q7T10_00525 [Rhodoferax sp.]|uniref:hypothetical protein n=1 Tax=Rhodoferax sp. TaxID=50421 RepID=UPI00271FFF86|nr:hypothetical protein [Rhodoferax sp.]MDO8447274.1 hypothetical protein [Rhodoferax sp.]
MEIFTMLMALAIGIYALKSRDQNRRIALLGTHLGKYQIEQLMESLTEGYLRTLGESDPERRAQIWNLLSTTEMALCEQFTRFVTEFSRVDEADARVSKLALSVPYAAKLFPSLTFDLRKALSIHAHGISHAANNTDQTPKDKAFTLSAELFLMQHTCHWFCRSKTVASARLLARHKTSYAQVLASVSPDTRKAYGTLTAG